MKYAKWLTNKEIKDSLVKIDISKKNKESGIPLYWQQNTPYITKEEGHTLLLGATGSGKTQSIILPYIKTCMLASVSMVINDKGGELYSIMGEKLKLEGYKTYVFNFENPSLSTGFNPLGLAYQLYKEEKYDESLKFLDVTSSTIFKESEGADPFWNNTAISLFKGLSLFLFANASSEEINFNSLYALASELNDDEKCQELLDKISLNSDIYMLLEPTLKAPRDTKLSILAVFNSEIKEYTSRSNLAKLLAHDDCSLFKILDEKFVIFINDCESSYSETLTSLLISQIYLSQKMKTKRQKINLLLDDFEELPPIKNFAKMLDISRGLSMQFLLVIKGYTNLRNAYGNYFDIIKMEISNIIYLRSTDLLSIEEISKLCGESSYHEMLISSQELKCLDKFEAVVLLPRKMPFKTYLKPDYKIDWGFELPETSLEKHEFKDIKVYKLD